MSRRRRRERVIITGINGNLGRRLARRLHRSCSVIGIDRRPARDLPKDVEFHQLDLRRRKTENIFRTARADAVVHLHIMHDPRATQEEAHGLNISATTKVLEFCAHYNIPKVVLLSSADVYGPVLHNNQFLDEQSPLLGASDFGDIRSLIELDMLASTFFWRYPSIETVILRPVHILGGVSNAASNYLRMKRPWTLMGFDPMVQVIHVEDVVAALALALKPGVKGIYNIVGPGEVPLSAIMKELGRRTLSIPVPLAKAALKLFWRFKLASFPAPELDHIRYICMVDGSRAKAELGFAPEFALQETIRAVEDYWR